jgi:putative transcriptional regulator
MKSLKSHLLIASPSLLDPNFTQTVVLMVQHDESGALGLILNRPTNMTVQEAWEQVSDVPCERTDPLYIGGPCEGVLMVLHPYEDAGQIEVLPGLYFSAETQHVTTVLERTDEKRMRFFVGYSGWASGQLEREMETGSWQVAPASIERVFAPAGPLWRQIKREMALMSITGRVNPKLLPSDPSRN